jgi:outer membrane receptor protein involved in Fe transport
MAVPAPTRGWKVKTGPTERRTDHRAAERLTQLKTIIGEEDVKPISILLASTAVILATPVAAYAQEVPPETGNSTDRQAEGGADEIVVTGSRVATTGNQAPTPVTIVRADQLLATTPTTVSEGLKQLPAFSLSSGNRTLNNSGSNASGSFLNLRGLGGARTLTLLDGRRVAGASAGGSVDTNTLPQLLLQRVDIVTGGASAVYGTDAVAGVVNFVLDHNFNGIKAVAQSGISEYGDAPQYRLGLAVGAKIFGGTGHIEASIDHYRSDGIGSQLDRPVGAAAYDWVTRPDGTRSIRANVRNVLGGTPGGGYGGYVVNGPFAGQQFGPGGQLIPFNNGVALTPGAGIQIGGDGSWGYSRSITADLDYDQGFLRYDQELGSSTKAFAQVGVSRVTNRNNFFPLFLSFNTIAADNAFLSPAQRQALATAGTSTFLINKAVVSTDPQRTNSRTETVDATVGLEGKLTSSLNWSAYYSHGENKTRVTNVGNVNVARRAAALDAVISPVSGQPVCRVTLTNPGLYPDCVPLNVFGPGAESAAAIDYIRDNTYFDLTNKIDNFGVTINGTLFNNWAGPVKAALTGEVRRVTARNRSTNQPTTLANCTGLPLNCGGPAYQTDVTSDFSAAQTIKEGALEVGIPLLKDVSFARSLSFNGAVRYADYSASGHVTTWKVGGDWIPIEGLRFRITRSRDIRAPTLLDLFGPQTLRPAFLDDTHTDTGGAINISSQGNPSLVPEVANTLTFGAVMQPAFLPRFSVAVDYYKINLSNGISTLSGLSSSVNQRCDDSNGTSPLCALYDRPLPFSNTTAANFPTLIRESPVNLASQRFSGIDAEVNYAFDIDKIGDFGIRLLGTYQLEAKNRTFPDDPYQELAGVAGTGGVPKTRINVNLRYSSGPFSLNVQTRWRSSMLRQPLVRPEFLTNDGRLPAASFTNIGASWDVDADSKKMQFFLNVQNLFNKAPPVQPSPFGGLVGFFYPTYQDDDVVGRYYTAGVRLNF